MPNVFHISELVEAIVSEMTTSERAVVISINRVWFDACIRHSWSSLTIRKALSPLGRIRSFRRGHFFAKPSPSSEQWERFRIYSKHVRIITGCDSEIELLKIATSFRPATVEYLFPKLHSLSWRTIYRAERLPDLSALISPRLRDVSLKFSYPGAAFFESVCNVLTRLPALQTLQIHLGISGPQMAECNASLNQVLETFASTLTRVQISECFHTPEVIQRLGQISNLDVLMIGPQMQFPFNGVPMAKGRTFGNDSTEAFGSLQVLIFSGSQTLLCDRLLNRFQTFNLFELDWHLCIELTDVESFVATIVKTCPQLRRLTVGNSRRSRKSLVVPWATVKPLLTCRSLITLSLYPCRIEMVLEDLIELLTSRRSPTRWQVLEIFTKIPLAISAISLFAEYCPDLSQLGINVGPSEACNDKISLHEVQSNPLSSARFSRLAYIDFADSAVNADAVLETAMLIDELCDTPPSIDGQDDIFCHTVATLLKQLHEEKVNARAIQ